MLFGHSKFGDRRFGIILISQASNHWSVSIEPCDSWRILLTVSFRIVAGGDAKLRN